MASIFFMFDITVDLEQDFALLTPLNGDTPKPLPFTRMDIDRPGCIVFYRNEADPGGNVFNSREVICSIIPWTSINDITFQKLTP